MRARRSIQFCFSLCLFFLRASVSDDIIVNAILSLIALARYWCSGVSFYQTLNEFPFLETNDRPCELCDSPYCDYLNMIGISCPLGTFETLSGGLSA